MAKKQGEQGNTPARPVFFAYSWKSGRFPVILLAKARLHWWVRLKADQFSAAILAR